MSNVANTGTLIGRLASDCKAFQNSDGSKKVLFNLYVDRAYKNSQGETVSDVVAVEAFVSNKVDGLGPYAYAHAGDLVAVDTHIEQKPYKAKNGETVYPHPKVVVDEIKFLESRVVTNARMAKRSVTQAAPQAAAPEAAAQTDAPAFGASAEAAPQADPATVGASTGGSVDYTNDTPFGAPSN